MLDLLILALAVPDWLINLVAPILASLGAALGALALAYLKKKLKLAGIELDAQQQAQLEHFVQRGITFAEEQARRFTKDSGDTLSGPQKQILAESFVASHLPDVSTEALQKAMTSLLPSVRQTIAPAVPDPKAPGQ